jgi:hypothetical protein
MSEPLDLAKWTEFYFTVATAAAALIGLIVVGLSIHADFIATSIAHRTDYTRIVNSSVGVSPSASPSALRTTSLIGTR